MPRCWLAVGRSNQWLEAFNHGNIWGLKADGRPAVLWEVISEGDQVIFYATTPIAGVIGCGTIRRKFKQDKPLWPAELEQKAVLWPLRFEFDIDRLVSFERWQEDSLQDKNIRLMARGGFQSLDSPIADRIIRDLSGEDSAAGPAPLQRSQHDQLKRMLVEAGIMQRYFAEHEYHLDNERLDVVWRRVANSVPTFVFEVQIGGDVYHALGKLKHAYDIWNSRIFIVAPESQRKSIETLLSGTFHEIQSVVRFLEVSQLEELYNLKRRLRDLEGGLGLL